MHWKLRRDPYLAPLADAHGEAEAFAAGFFLDEDEEDAALDDVDWRCTPLPARRAAERPVVLLSTGAFCPPHAGHLEMMERARSAAERAGYDVLGGYLSPGHDAYIDLKCGALAIPAPVRLRMCADAIAGSSWLRVDPWEALYRRVSVNFTDVTARLRAYVRAHLDPRTEVLYVCGGDNARFGLAFTAAARDGCVIVGRRGAEGVLSSWQRRLEGHARVLWSEGDHPASSTALRTSTWADDTLRRLVLRIEDARAVRTLGIDGRAFAAFQGELSALLGEHAAVRAAGLRKPTDERDVISLDAMLPAATNLAVSRLYAVGGYQALGHVARPGSPPLGEQLSAIAAGTYALRDDDHMSGGTLDAVRAMLPAGIVIAGTRLAVEHDHDEEVVDSRDFLLGADDGGLVVELPDGRIGRAPYVLPYVDPSARCCVPPRQVHAFSRAIWALNERTFAGSGLRVADLPASARATFGWLGQERLLEDVCRWHIERLESVSPLVRPSPPPA
jgi:nicotinic acid mononucleotide adenylyltransferase